MEQEEIGVKRTNGLNEDLHAIKIDQKHLYYSIYKSHTFTQGTFSSLFLKFYTCLSPSSMPLSDPRCSLSISKVINDYEYEYYG
jgi:hypothetical protein